MIPYDSEFKDNKPDYVINGLEFIGTCGSFPEQYDILYSSSDGNKYQVAYIRLRGARLLCTVPDVCGTVLFYKDFRDTGDKCLGCFETEEQRVSYLTLIADCIVDYLEKLSYGYC